MLTTALIVLCVGGYVLLILAVASAVHHAACADEQRAAKERALERGDRFKFECDRLLAELERRGQCDCCTFRRPVNRFKFPNDRN